ncbi:MAG: hypothetical protein QXD43_01510 [Candidatus Aenigmatarchaeota archaeon]
MSEKRKKQVRKAVEKAFRYYHEERNYDGHIKQPEIIEESNEFAEKLAEKEMHKGRGFDYIASIATFLVCESHGCPINLNMVKEFSKDKIKTKDLHEARKITGVEPKFNPIDWVDDVVRTLKNKNYISTDNEEKIIENAVLELNKINKEQSSPRYKAIKAVYRAMKNSEIPITQEDVQKIFNISIPVLREKRDFSPINKKVVEFLKNNPETFYQAKDLVKILNLDIDSKSLSLSLSVNSKKLGILRLSNHRSYFGFSNECGSGKCDINWCYGKTDYLDKPLCKRGSRNEKIKFYSKD